MVRAPHISHDKRGFFVRLFMSTSHKHIGILYFLTAAILALAIFLVHLIMRIELMDPGVMRIELMEPGVQYMCRESNRLANLNRTHMWDAECIYNAPLWHMIIAHGDILFKYCVIIPALFGGVGNYFMPKMIGAPDMAFPRINKLSCGLYIVGAVLMIVSVFIFAGSDTGMGAAFDASPIYAKSVMSKDFAILGVRLLGISSIFNATHIIITFLNLRAIDIQKHKARLFAWLLVIAASLTLLLLPVFEDVIRFTLIDRNFGVSFFDISAGVEDSMHSLDLGIPILRQFWSWLGIL